MVWSGAVMVSVTLSKSVSAQCGPAILQMRELFPIFMLTEILNPGAA